MKISSGLKELITGHEGRTGCRAGLKVYGVEAVQPTKL